MLLVVVTDGGERVLLSISHLERHSTWAAGVLGVCALLPVRLPGEVCRRQLEAPVPPWCSRSSLSGFVTHCPHQTAATGLTGVYWGLHGTCRSMWANSGRIQSSTEQRSIRKRPGWNFPFWQLYYGHFCGFLRQVFCKFCLWTRQVLLWWIMLSLCPDTTTYSVLCV